MNDNNDRYDLSDSLIHFFRSVNPTNEDAPAFPDHWGFDTLENYDKPLSPFFLMRNAIRRGRLWASWSVRGGKRTIYGPHPAVCFTEMPIAAFIEAGIARSGLGQAMSPYGLVLPKAQIFQEGARPVIYALSGETTVSTQPDESRVIATSQLPLLEQYRYVTFNPTGAHPVDWTHEREWRWPERNPPDIPPGDIPAESEELNGLDLDNANLRGFGVIVKTREQAERVVYDILTKIDRGDIPRNQYRYVLPIEEVAAPSDLRDRAGLNSAIANARINLAPYFKMDNQSASSFTASFSDIVREIEQSASAAKTGEIGGCWLWLTDNRHDLTRALVWQGRVIVTNHGKYIAHLPEFSSLRSLAQREEMTMILAQRIKQKYGVDAVYFSVLGSDNPDVVPFYNGDLLDDRNIYNKSDNPKDY